MAELAPVERLQPFLLDRLADDQPDTSLESRERRVMSPRDYRRAVLRDLQWLLNAAAHPKTDRLEEYPEVAKSVLNFGMPTLSGQTASGVTPVMVERLVRNAIAAYEPRVIQQTIQVTAVESEDNTAPYIIRLEIRGEAWNLPMPESLYIRTEVDLDTGQVKLSDPSSSG
jgi:type VI secretion system protein ImpF